MCVAISPFLGLAVAVRAVVFGSCRPEAKEAGIGGPRPRDGFWAVKSITLAKFHMETVCGNLHCHLLAGMVAEGINGSFLDVCGRCVVYAVVQFNACDI